MKKIFNYIIFSALLAVLFPSCQKLDVEIDTQLTPSAFPKDSVQFVQATGPAYAALRGNFSLDYYFLQTLSSDEAILPARGGNWYDNQGYLMLHYHSWTKDHAGTNSTWGWLSKIIGTTNQILSILDQNMPVGNNKNVTLSELKMIRAISYYLMMDLYGNLPLDTVYGEFEPRANVSRTEVFNFIEKEVKACIPYLNPATGVTTYGRPNKYTAYALLAKMYVNAEYYTGTARYNECIEACDNIISSGKYALESRATYLKMFYPDNGPNTKEFIFAIPYDPAASALPGTNGYMFHSRYDVPRSLRAKFGLQFTPSAPQSTLPEFYAHFNDPNDVRNGQWIKGLQFLNDGVTPVTVKTTKKGYDQFYTGADGGASYTYQVDITPNVILRQDPNAFDCGNDEIAWNMGYRNIKFFPDNVSLTRNQSNDVPIFRYSDIILMKAEAILRGGTATLSHTALSLANQLRAERTTSPAWGNITLDSIYNERSREFTWETWHRNDMIRFGRFEDSYGFKTNNDPTRRIFPIPTSAMVVNPKLTQNPGY